MGCSLHELIENKLITNEELYFYSHHSESNNYFFMVIVNLPLKTIYVPLKSNHTDKDILFSFYFSILLGIATSVSNNIQLVCIKFFSMVF